MLLVYLWDHTWILLCARIKNYVSSHLSTSSFIVWLTPWHCIFKVWQSTCIFCLGIQLVVVINNILADIHNYKIHDFELYQKITEYWRPCFVYIYSIMWWKIITRLKAKFSGALIHLLATWPMRPIRIVCLNSLRNLISVLISLWVSLLGMSLDAASCCH